jgi:hypothetical protein
MGGIIYHNNTHLKMQKCRTKDHLNTWSPNKRIRFNYREKRIVVKIKNLFHIHHVGHKLEFIICKHCEYETFRGKIAFSLSQENMQT